MPDEQSRRRVPLGVIIVAALLVLSIGGVAWWLYRPRSDVPTGPALADLDVVCLGRVDGLTPVASLEPLVPGRVAEVFVSDGQSVKAGDRLLKLDDESLRLREEEARAAVTAAAIEVEAAELDKTLYPLRKATQEAAVTSARDRVATARKLIDEKKAAQKFGTVTAGELIAAESEIRQLEQLEGVEKTRLEEVKGGEAALALRVKAA